MTNIIFDSQGNVEPWGRDFWTENYLGYLLFVVGGTLLVGALILGLIVFLITL